RRGKRSADRSDGERPGEPVGRPGNLARHPRARGRSQSESGDERRGHRRKCEYGGTDDEREQARERNLEYERRESRYSTSGRREDRPWIRRRRPAIAPRRLTLPALVLPCVGLDPGLNRFHGRDRVALRQPQRTERGGGVERHANRRRAAEAGQWNQPETG